jgi:hypothetical protein
LYDPPIPPPTAFANPVAVVANPFCPTPPEADPPAPITIFTEPGAILADAE